MNRREFVTTTSLTLAGCALLPQIALGANPDDRLRRHRFGLNYVPSRNWAFSWNDWKPEDIARDFDSIAAIGADHIRITLIWPWFQPNPIFVSPAHLDRLEELMRLANERKLDVLVTLYTGWLSGYAFKPPYLEQADFYSDPKWKPVRDLYLLEVSKRLKTHPNFLGFDLGNEINCCWKGSPTAVGDAWMDDVFMQLSDQAPGRIHVNGVDHGPFFRVDTFSPEALVAQQDIVALHCWPQWTGAKKYGSYMDKPSIHLQSAMAALARSYGNAPAKPVWVQEFGLSPNPDVADFPKWLELVVTSGIEGGVSWFTWWKSHDVERQFQFSSEQYTRGLITVENKIKEQGFMFKRLADAYRGKLANIPKKSPPPPPARRTDETTWQWMLDWMEWKAK